MYIAVSASLPTASAPAAICMLALPLLSTVGAEVKPPPDNVTEPVGVGLPLPPPTVTLTVADCEVVMLEADGTTVTVGALFDGVVTVTVAAPVALL